MDDIKVKDVSKDVDGKESSKRKYGMRLLNIGIGMAVLYFLLGMFMTMIGKVFEYDFPFDIWLTFMGTGSGLLGITLVERFSVKK